MTLEVLRVGPAALVQDLGRSGYARLGVPRSGAFDVGALRTANRLVGNRECAAGIEVVYGGLALRAQRAVTLAVTGAPCGVSADTIRAAWGEPITVPSGTVLSIGTPTRGLRSYVAVRGGLGCAAVLGSRSTDTLSALGPSPLRAGDVLGIGREADGPVRAGLALFRSLDESLEGHVVVVRLGPRDDWLEPESVGRLLSTAWTVRGDADRVGVRLDGPPLARRVRGELPSEAVRPGAVQVPGDGRPIVFGPDAPVTGGYPVVAVALDLDRLAQVRPGDTVRFVLDRARRNP